jgi:Ca2+-binding EF-hand superfamily protein
MNELLLRKRREVELQLAAQISPRTRAHVRAVFETHANANANARPADRSRGGPLGAPPGALGTHVLRAAVEEMGHAPSEAQLATLLAEFDFDGSGALDPLEFTALMSRMLGYRELPAAQMVLLKGVFDYVDVDDKGGITQPELAVVVDKFGLKLNEAQLGEYLAEFDTDGDGQISRVEFCSLMAKLQGLVGITANPNLVTKDLQMTVRKLDGLVAANEQRAQRALAALLKEAQVPCKCSASAAAAAAALRTTSPELGYRGGCGGGEPPSGLSSSRRARGLLPEDDGAAASGRRRGASSRRRSRVPAAGDGEGKSLPGKLQLLKSAATSIMGANTVQRVFGGAPEPPAEQLQASSSLLEREADANLEGGGGDGGDASGPPVGPPRTPESLIC